MWIEFAGLRAWTSNSRGALATCSSTKSGSRKTVLSSTCWPAWRNRSSARSSMNSTPISVTSRRQPRVEGRHRVLGQDLVARHLVAEHRASCDGVARSMRLTGSPDPSLIMWNCGSTSWNLSDSCQVNGGSMSASETSQPASGTQAVDRAAAAGRRPSSRPTSRSPSPTSQEACGLRQVHDLAAAHRARAHRPARARRRRRPTSPAACSGCTPPGTTRGEELVRLARPTLERDRRGDRRDRQPRVARGDRVVQVAQVDSRFLLGTRDWTEVDVPAHCSALGKVLLRLGRAADARPGRSSSSTERDPHRPRRAAARRSTRTRQRGYAVTVDELEVGLDRHRRPRPRHPRRGRRGARRLRARPHRLEDRLDELGRAADRPRRAS